ncbi:MAG: hydrogenase 4 subunit F [Acidobacteria bacterium]|nr:hydrogenase 4 subunit F [Acidobacteriota bacterium]
MTLVALLAVPLLAAAFNAFPRGRRAMEVVHFVSAVMMLVLSLVVAGQVLRYGSISWASGFFYVDYLSGLVVLLTGVIYFPAALYAIGYLRHDVLEDAGDEDLSAAQVRKYYALTPLFGFCMFLVPMANNLGVMWVAVEGTTLASILLVTYYGRSTSLEAAWKYAIIGGVGLSLAFFGTVLTYYAAHHGQGQDSMEALNWSFLIQHAAQFDRQASRLAFILVLLGYGTKLGLAPMHTWKPDAYSEAPVPVTALMAAGVLNCAVYALARFHVLIAGCLGTAFGSQLLILFGLLSVGIAVPFILVQRNLRRLLAYSSIDHAGIMVMGLGFGGALGAMGVLLHMTFHSVLKPLLFFCAGNIQQARGSDALGRGAIGLLRTMPLSAPLMLMGVIAVTGTPPFSMFQSEFTILRAGFAAHEFAASILLVLFLVAIFCGFFFHVSQLVLGPAPAAPQNPEPTDFENDRWKTLPVVALSVVAIVLAFWLPSPLYDLISGAARILEVRP